jgi:hypothetical protein
VGALYLIIISLIPEWMIAGIHLNNLPFWMGGSMFDHLPNWVTARPERELLLWRNLAADRGGRGDGYGQPDRIPAHHASLRRIYAEAADAFAGRNWLVRMPALEGGNPDGRLRKMGTEL